MAHGAIDVDEKNAVDAAVRTRRGHARERVQHGAFRECQRLRLMLFIGDPGYQAFLQYDWLLPRTSTGYWSFFVDFFIRKR